MPLEWMKPPLKGEVALPGAGPEGFNAVADAILEINR
jgi:hypothetical protein